MVQEDAVVALRQTLRLARESGIPSETFVLAPVQCRSRTSRGCAIDERDNRAAHGRSCDAAVATSGRTWRTVAMGQVNMCLPTKLVASRSKTVNPRSPALPICDTPCLIDLPSPSECHVNLRTAQRIIATGSPVEINLGVPIVCRRRPPRLHS